MPNELKPKAEWQMMIEKAVINAYVGWGSLADILITGNRPGRKEEKH